MQSATKSGIVQFQKRNNTNISYNLIILCISFIRRYLISSNIWDLIKSTKIPFFRFSSGMFSIIKTIRFILKQTSHDLYRSHDRQHLETPKINVIMFTKTEIIIKGKMIILKAAERRSSFFLLILINHQIFLGYLYTNM